MLILGYLRFRGCHVTFSDSKQTFSGLGQELNSGPPAVEAPALATRSRRLSKSCVELELVLK